MKQSRSHDIKRARRSRISLLIFVVLALALGSVASSRDAKWAHNEGPATTTQSSPTTAIVDRAPARAADALASVAVKGRAAKTGYTREQFGRGWAESAGCDTRNRVLQRDLVATVLQPNGCEVRSGVLRDPYSGRDMNFVRGAGTSQAVQIDHVVALSDAWQKGGQLLSPELRVEFANDGLNLLAVDGKLNMQKSDGDAATWLPPNKSFRCAYVSRQIAVKYKYSLWVTAAEQGAMNTVLKKCPDQPTPTT